MALLTIMTAELGPPTMKGDRAWWCCRFHTEFTPSLTIVPPSVSAKERWKCFGCGLSGDAIDFVRRVHDLGFAAAKAKIATDYGISFLKGPKANQGCKSARAQQKPPGGGAPLGLPRCCEIVVRGGAARIWDYHDVVSWLRRRGLHDQTIRAAKLGLNEEGLLIPWFGADGRLAALNIRRGTGEPKYRLEKGSAKGGIYPHTTLDYRRPVLLCEGELDTLLARQEAGDLVQAITLGSAGDAPATTARMHLALCRSVFIALDADAAGDRGAKHLAQLLPGTKRLRPPEGMDLTDIHKCRTLRTWLNESLKGT